MQVVLVGLKRFGSGMGLCWERVWLIVNYFCCLIIWRWTVSWSNIGFKESILICPILSHQGRFGLLMVLWWVFMLLFVVFCLCWWVACDPPKFELEDIACFSSVFNVWGDDAVVFFMVLKGLAQEQILVVSECGC